VLRLGGGFSSRQAGFSAKAKKRLQKAIGTAGVHVTAELDAEDAFHRSHRVAVCLVCAAKVITHRCLVSGGIIEASKGVTADQVRE
jgi:hypothetical protein